MEFGGWAGSDLYSIAIQYGIRPRCSIYHDMKDLPLSPQCNGKNRIKMASLLKLIEVLNCQRIFDGLAPDVWYTVKWSHIKVLNQIIFDELDGQMCGATFKRSHIKVLNQNGIVKESLMDLMARCVVPTRFRSTHALLNVKHFLSHNAICTS